MQEMKSAQWKKLLVHNILSIFYFALHYTIHLRSEFDIFNSLYCNIKGVPYDMPFSYKVG